MAERFNLTDEIDRMKAYEAKTAIALPPLPVADPDLVKRFGPPTYTLDQLRARDLEVARVVLEAAAKKADKEVAPWIASAIRALELHHAE